MGRALGNMIINLSARDEIKESIEELGLDLNVIEITRKPDAALGNGGLGSSLQLVLRHGNFKLSCIWMWNQIQIRYVQQKIENGYQKEIPEIGFKTY